LPKNERSRGHAQACYLPTWLAASEQTLLIAVILIALVVGIVMIFGRFGFARTARQSLLEG